jgi:acyl-CoA reductase-like NAD-dependent aldehyde dehydrogenase
MTHDDVAKVAKDPRINYVAFTGSVEGGRAIQNAVGQRFINSGLELGGKDPAYVRADADLNYAIENLVDGAFFNSGQSCCGIERIYVHDSIFDTFVEGFTAMTYDYVLDHPMLAETTLGPVVRRSSASFIRQQVIEAISQGAKGLIDPNRFAQHEISGAYMAPQVLVNVNHDMRVMTEETFGPVVGIMPVKSDEEAIRLMNDSSYGLTASIWTHDDEIAESIADKIDTGTCFQNRCDYLDPALAWTGVKNSGKGCTLSSLGYDTLTRPKSYHLKKILYS